MFSGRSPPGPGGEAPSNVDLVMYARLLIHLKPTGGYSLTERMLRPFSAAAGAPKLVGVTHVF